MDGSTAHTESTGPTEPAGQERPGGRPRDGGVRSLGRALQVLDAMDAAGGETGLSGLAAATGMPMATVHRIVRTLLGAGYVRQQPDRRYVLGPRLIRLGETAGRLVGGWSEPYLRSLTEETGETANLALLEGDSAVYVAQKPSRHAMRVFAEVGRRVLPHCTGVGKALLAQLPPGRVEMILERTGMPAMTPLTRTDPALLAAELAQVRALGWARDDDEQEMGVRCVAAPVPGAATPAALSVTGPASRLTEEAVQRIVPLLIATAGRLGADLS